MLCYCLNYKKKIESKTAKVVKVKKWKNNAFIKMFGVQ